MQKQDLYWKILDAKRKALLPKLGFLKEEGFYLAGGTALALQIGHRKSLDFDFYKKESFAPGDLQNALVSKLGAENVKLSQMTQGFLGVEIGGIEVTFFLYPYHIIKLLEFDFGFVASIQDIAGMKMIAIVQRGTKRDFVDLYFLIKDMGLKKILEAVTAKYPGYNLYVGLQALLYFEDAERGDNTAHNRFDPIAKFNWEEVKKYIRQEVFSVQKML